jgi:uncharacterized HAD superfamily protein
MENRAVKKGMKKIGLDIDGVVCDFVSEIIRLGREQHNLDENWPMTHDEWTAYDMPGFDVVWKEHHKKKTFWLGLSPYEDRELKFDPAFYITSRPCDSAVSEHWLMLHGFPTAPVRTVGMKASKVAAFREFGEPDTLAFVDDKPENFIELNQAGVTCLLLDRPWNRKIPGGLFDNHRIFSLLEVLPKLKELEDAASRPVLSKV